MSALRKLVLLVGAFGATVVLGFALCWLPRPLPPLPDTPSVPTFGHDPLRSGAMPSPLSVERYKPLVASDVPHTEHGHEAAPVYWNGARDRIAGIAGPVEGRRVLFVGSRRRMNAIDLDTHELLWRVELEWHRSDSTPVIDLARGRLYFSTYLQAGEPPAPEWAREPYRMRLHAIGLDGRGLHGFELPLDRLLASDLVTPEAPPSSILHCRTALGLSDAPGAHYVFLGCGMRSAGGRHAYAVSRGARGLLIAAHLDEEGRLLGPDALSVFTPSRVTANPATGFDTGIWHAGAGPSQLPDGSLLVATGNGPFLPAEGNYGCSVVRVDGRRFAPAENDGGAPFYSLDGRGYAECHAMNADLSCSSIASLAKGGRLYSVLAGKDGRLRSFDPFRLPGDDVRQRVETDVGGLHCGAPSIRRDESGAVQVVVGGSRRPAVLRRGGDWFLASPSLASRLDAGHHERGACIAFAHARGGDGRVPLELHHSGRLRRDHVLLASGSELTRRIASGTYEWAIGREAVDGQSTGRLAPYRPVGIAGWSAAPEAAEPPAGFAYDRLQIHSSIDGGLYAFPESLPREGLLEPVGAHSLGGPLQAGRPFGSDVRVLVAKQRDSSGGFCGAAPAPGLVPLHLHRSRPVAEPESGWVVSAFRVAEDHRLEPRWRHERDDGTRYPVSSLATTLAPPGETGLVVFPVLEQSENRARLVLLNAATGALVDEIPFAGRPHFTIPVVVGDRIYLSTRDSPLRQFHR